MFMKSSYKSSWRIGFSSVFLLIIFSITNNLQHDALSKEINLTINPQNTLHRIDPKLYSHFLEHIYNSCNGGLWGELIWNRSLEAGKASEWSFKDGVLIQESTAEDCRFLLGNEESSLLTDFDLRVVAKKTSGREGFLILFRCAKDMSSYYWLNLGGWDNRYVAIEKETLNSQGRHMVGAWKEIPPIKEGELYDIRILAIGRNIKVFVNQEMIHEVVDNDKEAPQSGYVGVGTWGTKAEFGHVCVRDMNRKVVYELSSDEALQTPQVDVRYWNVKGNVHSQKKGALNSSRSLSFEGEGLLSQEKIHLRKETPYIYSFWAKGNGSISLTYSLDKSVETEILNVEVSSDSWQKIEGTFTPVESSIHGSIQFNVTPDQLKNVELDQISLIPQDWVKNNEGFRPDLLKAIEALHPQLIRWPGGCYASAYRWKSGIGPQDFRTSYPLELWNDIDVNSFGTDEFIKLCRRVNAEPLIVVNVGTPQWLQAVGDPALRENDWIQEVCDWVEYCNGPISSKWGAVRAQNGHPEPYGVKYWEIDNEVRPTDCPAEMYTSILNQLIPRMKAIDPTIKIIACGSWMGDKLKWDADVIKMSGKNFDYLSLHRYDDPSGFAFNPWDNQKFYEEHRALINASDNPQIKLFSSEWNAQSTDWRTGLHAGGYLNCCERVADLLEIATPALFLRHESANDWDNAFINFNNHSWYPAPKYVVMQLWQDNFAPNLIEISSESPELSGNSPLINTVATKSDDGKTVYLKSVNNFPESVKFTVDLNTDTSSTIRHSSLQFVSPEISDKEDEGAKLLKRNTFEEPSAITVQKSAVLVEDGKVIFDVPSYSASVLKIELSE